MGVSDIWRRTANVTGLSVSEVRTLFMGGSLDTLMPGKDHSADMKQSVDAILGNIIAEIRLSFDYFNTEKNMPVGRICLTGDGVFLNGVEAAFASHFDIPFVKWNPADMLAVAADADRDGFVQEGRRMVVALGLGLSHYD